MVSTWFFPGFVVLGLLMVMTQIPHRFRRRLFTYGLLLGGLGDIIVVLLFQNLLHVIRFKNLGMFNVLGLELLSPLVWTLVVMLVLYHLPRRPLFRALYVIAWGVLSTGYGYLVHNIGLFDFVQWWYPIPTTLVFIGWWATIVWVYTRTSALAEDPDPVNHA